MSDMMGGLHNGADGGLVVQLGTRRRLCPHGGCGARSAIALLSYSRGRNGMKSGMASSSMFSSIYIVLPPLSREISISLSKSAGL